MGAPHGAASFDPKITAYVLGSCAIAILIGIFTRSWMSGREGAGGVGPLGLEVCFGRDSCRSVGWDVPGIPGDIPLIGYLTLFSGLAAAAASAYIAFLVYSNTPHRLPKFKLVNIAFGVASFATTFFAIRLLIESGKQFSISYSPLFAIGGVVTAGIFVRKLRAFWPGEGNMPWPVATARPPGYGAPIGPPPLGPPMGPPSQPFGAGPPMGAPPSQPFGAPMGAPHRGPQMGAAPMGAPHMGPQMGAPMSAPPIGPPSSPPPMSAPPMGPPMGAPPMGPPPSQPFGGGPPTGGPPMAHGGAMQPAGQFCGRCGKPMTFVAQYQRWFCQQCQQYA